MKNILVYPVNFSLWEQHKQFVSRFARTFKHYPPEADYELWVMCAWGEPIDQIRRWFYGIKTRFEPYYMEGCDIGAAQTIASVKEEGFIVGFPTHAYFHREGWLKRLRDARDEYGPGMYSPAGSFEGAAHLRTCGYGLDAPLFRDYPVSIESRKECEDFERGPKSMTAFVNSLSLPCFQVTWDGVQRPEDWRKPEGIFRRGEQNAMLVWDRHTDAYKEADDKTKALLADLADGLPA